MADINFNTGKQTAFNPDIAEKENPDFTRYSRGVEVDDSLGGLFKNAGSILSTAVAAADKRNEIRNREEATDAVDNIRDKYIGFAEDVPVGAASSTVPEGLQARLDRVRKLDAANKNGVLKDSSYWMQIEAESRRLRSKYPAYREQIDNVFSDLTGNVPANALRSALQREAAAASSGQLTDEKRIQMLEDKHLKDLPAEYLKDKAEGNPWSFSRLQAVLNRKLAGEANESAERARQLFNWQKEAHSETALNNIRKEVAVTATRHFYRDFDMDLDDKSNILGLTKDNLDMKIRELSAKSASGATISAKEQAEAAGLLAQYKRYTINKFNELITAPREEYNGQSYKEFGRLSKSDEENILAPKLRELDVLQEAIVSGDYSFLKANKIYSESILNQDKKNLLTDEDGSKDTWLRRYQANKSILGPEAMNTILTRDFSSVTKLDDAQKSIADQVLSGIIVDNEPGRGGNDNHEKDLKDAKRVGAEPRTLSYITQKAVETFTMPSVTDPQALSTMADKLWGNNTNFLSQFPIDERSKVFQRMITPAVAKKMSVLPPEQINKIHNWAAQSWLALFESEAVDVRNIGQGVGTSSTYKIVYNPSSSTFSFREDEAAVKARASQNNPSTLGGQLLRDQLEGESNLVGRKVEDLNRAVNGLLQFYKGLGVENPQEEILKTLSATKGLMNSVFVEKERGVFQMGIDAIIGAMEAALPSRKSVDAKANAELTGREPEQERDKLLNAPLQFTRTGGAPSTPLRAPKTQPEANALNDYNEATVALVLAGRSQNQEDWVRAKQAWDKARQTYADYFGIDPGRAIGVPDSDVQALDQIGSRSYTPGDRQSTNVEDRRSEDTSIGTSSGVRQMDPIEEILRMGESGPYTRPGLRESDNIEDRRK
jgi:hypothetical protein